MRVVFSDASRLDLRAIAAFIAADNPTRALAYVDELEAACNALSSHPQRFAVIPALQSRDYRRRPFGNYAIIYSISGDMVQIVRVLHAAMDLNTLLDG